MTEQAIIIIDNFYRDPHRTRKEALLIKYPPHQLHYPGRISVRPPRNRILRVAKRIEQRIGQELIFDQGEGSGCYRYMLKKDTVGGHKDTVIHHDYHDWVAVIYLTLSRHCRGGLAFYSHNITGISGLKDWYHIKKAKKKFKMNTTELFNWLYRDSLDLKKWTVRFYIGMVFNRLVLFDATFFHRITEKFGTMIDNARLTQNFRFQIKR